MKRNAIFVHLLGLAAVILGIALLTPLDILIDLPSMILVFGSLSFMLIVSHGWGSVQSHLVGGIRRLWFPTGASPWTDKDRAKAARIANSAGLIVMFSGGIGTLIGVVQMLQSLDDPTKIGPALAVAFLSPMYAVAFHLCLFLPLARHYTVALGDAGGLVSGPADVDAPMWNSVFILGFMMFTVLSTFLLMLMAMCSFE